MAPDAFTCAFCASMSATNLVEIHSGLCHPGVTRMLHFVRCKDLSCSTEDVRKVCSSCKIYAELKPQFYRPSNGKLIKSARPMEMLSIDFKGPAPSASQNKYLLTVVDEYSRFPFAFPCQSPSAPCVMKCLDQTFALCGAADFIHFDRGPSFISRELKSYLTERGIATSASLIYYPVGNGQVECYNGIIWKGVCLALKSHGLPDSQWEMVLPEVLHSIRSLLSTATKTTPH